MTTPTRLAARPTTYNGIQMRSRLEASFAAFLDRQNCEWVYEPECFASPAGQYLPDFHLPNVEALGTAIFGSFPLYIEVKPTRAHLDPAEHQRLEGIIGATTPGILLLAAGDMPSALFGSGSREWYGWVPDRPCLIGGELLVPYLAGMRMRMWYGRDWRAT